VPVKLSGFKIDDKAIVQCGRTVKIEHLEMPTILMSIIIEQWKRITLDLNKI